MSAAPHVCSGAHGSSAASRHSMQCAGATSTKLYSASSPLSARRHSPCTRRPWSVTVRALRGCTMRHAERKPGALYPERPMCCPGVVWQKPPSGGRWTVALKKSAPSTQRSSPLPSAASSRCAIARG